MKKATCVFIAISLVMTIAAGGLLAADKGSLTVIVKGFKNLEGRISVGLYYGKDGFHGKGPRQFYRGQHVKPEGDSVRAEFTGIKTGEYMVAVFHDENSNEDLDTNMLGLPKEAYGFSNNASGMFGPPSFEDAKIVVTENRPLEIEINIK